MSAKTEQQDHDMPDGGVERSAKGSRAEALRDRGRKAASEARRKSEFIVSRAYGLFANTDQEWDEVRREETHVASILLGYVAPLAAILPVCNFIGSQAFGVENVRPPMIDALKEALVGAVSMVAVVFLIGILINAVAENFDADQDDLASQKVAAYSLTPFMLSGIVWLWPPLWWVSIVALAASVFLLYRGLMILMKAPADRALGYALSVAAAALALFVIVFGLANLVT